MIPAHSSHSPHTFEECGVEPAILAALAKRSITTPTPIQAQSIPPALEGKDVVGIAQTGTGKTLAFGVPMLQRLHTQNGLGLIIAPTRELALQIDESLSALGRSLGIGSAVLIGGANMRTQVAALRRNPHIVIATPGRLIDHLEQGTIRLHGVTMLVLDEADRMLDMGFEPQMKKIFAAVSAERQTMLFSATLSNEIMAIAQKHMQLPVRIEVAPQGTTAERVTQEFFVVHREQKQPLLEKLLQDYSGSTLIFTRTKHGTRKLALAIRKVGHNVSEIHGDRSLGQRREALEGFKSGKYRILVATDIASRGIDVKGIELVINFDLPTDSSEYVHRIGRTARAGADGHAISFALPSEARDVRTIERLINKSIKVAELPPEVPGPRAQMVSERPQRPQGRSSYHSRPQAGRGGPRRPFSPRHSRGGSSRSGGFRGRRPQSR